MHVGLKNRNGSIVWKGSGTLWESVLLVFFNSLELALRKKCDRISMGDFCIKFSRNLEEASRSLRIQMSGKRKIMS